MYILYMTGSVWDLLLICVILLNIFTTLKVGSKYFITTHLRSRQDTQERCGFVVLIHSSFYKIKDPFMIYSSLEQILVINLRRKQAKQFFIDLLPAVSLETQSGQCSKQI